MKKVVKKSVLLISKIALVALWLMAFGNLTPFDL